MLEFAASKGYVISKGPAPVCGPILMNLPVYYGQALDISYRPSSVFSPSVLSAQGRQPALPGGCRAGNDGATWQDAPATCGGCRVQG